MKNDVVETQQPESVVLALCYGFDDRFQHRNTKYRSALSLRLLAIQ